MKIQYFYKNTLNTHLFIYACNVLMASTLTVTVVLVCTLYFMLVVFVWYCSYGIEFWRTKLGELFAKLCAHRGYYLFD